MAVSAMGIITSIGTLFLMPLLGITQGAQPIIGYNYGAKLNSRVRSCVKLSMLASTAIALLGFLVVMIFPSAIFSIFGGGAELMDFGVRALRIYMLLFCVVGIQIVGANFYQAVGRPVKSTILSMLRQLFLLIPLILLLPLALGLDGLIIATPIADAISLIITATCLIFTLKNIKVDKVGEQKILKNLDNE